MLESEGGPEFQVHPEKAQFAAIFAMGLGGPEQFRSTQVGQ
jgi:hypothetical protein